jgi:hypothetical protein
MVDDCFGDLKAAFLNDTFPKAGNFHFLKGDGDIEDELLIKCQSGHDRFPYARLAREGITRQPRFDRVEKYSHAKGANGCRQLHFHMASSRKTDAMPGPRRLSVRRCGPGVKGSAESRSQLAG